MFQSKTLFILGAGSSHEFGLPLGKELKDLIIKEISKERNENIILKSFEKSQKNSISFEEIEQIKDAMIQNGSIDDFLYKHSKKDDIQLYGKLGIIECILKSERESNIFNDIRESFQEDNWFNNFWNILSSDVSSDKVSEIFEKVSFINFNYDRCVEHLLYNSIKKNYILDSETTSNIMKKLEIVHPYGTLGSLPWQSDSMSIPVDFGAQDVDISLLVKNIITYNEGVSEESIKIKINKYIIEADSIVFLGFGFHDQNLKLLENTGFEINKKIFYTVYDASNEDIPKIKSKLENIFNNKLIIKITGQGITCSQFIKYHKSNLKL